MLVFRAKTNKMLVRIENREDSDQSDMGLHCFSRPFSRGASVRKSRTFTINE